MGDLLILSVLCGLATWRLTSLLHSEDAFEWLRKWIKIGHDDEGYPTVYPDTFWGRQFKCFWCLAGWVAVLPVTIATISTHASLLYAIMMYWPSWTIGIWLERQLMRSRAR